MSKASLPVGVLIPTLNVQSALSDHLASLITWSDLVQEIVVVDSYSTDGTLERLRAELKHPRLRILQCPPGLYQAWNHGIRHLRSKFTYISTVGDTITREGLEHLVATAEAMQTEVLISPPQLVHAEGTPAVEKHWPIHTLIENWTIQRPTRISRSLAFLMATLHLPESILGSSASNLYLTDTLKRFPFPTEFGHAGDTAWGIRHTLSTSLAVTPRSVSRFVFHRDDQAQPELEKQALVRRLLELARQAVREVAEQPRTRDVSEPLAPSVHRLPFELERLHERQWRYDEARRAFPLWILSPAAWQARWQRNRQRSRLGRTKNDILHYASPVAQLSQALEPRSLPRAS